MVFVNHFSEHTTAGDFATHFKFHVRIKHIDLRYHVSCEAVENAKVELNYQPRRMQLIFSARHLPGSSSVSSQDFVGTSRGLRESAEVT